MKKFWKPVTILCLVGVLLLAGGLTALIDIYRSRETNIVATPPPVVTPQQIKSAGYIGGEPTQISIPSLRISLPVIPGYYDKQTHAWTLTTSDVQYAAMTPQPNNQSGETFLYGHARTNIFGSLHDIHSGAQAVVTTSNHHTFYYQLSDVHVVSPDDSKSIFDYGGKPILTVQTCTGLFWQYRQLFIFSLVKVA